jgi:hypothetical protein
MTKRFVCAKTWHLNSSGSITNKRDRDIRISYRARTKNLSDVNYDAGPIASRYYEYSRWDFGIIVIQHLTIYTRRCYRWQRPLLPSAVAVATFGTSGYYHRKRPLLQSVAAVATFSARGRYHRRRLLLPAGLLSAPADAAVGARRCYHNAAAIATRRGLVLQRAPRRRLCPTTSGGAV